METITLKANKRALLGKKVRKIRVANQLPAIIYGKKFENLPIVLDKSEFEKIAQTAGESTLINLDMDNQEPIKVLIRDIQRHPVKDWLLHVDLYKVDMDEEIETEIPLSFEGESPAVEELEGNLITNKTTIKVKCLPDKLVSEIIIDVSTLKTFEDLIHIKDIIIPQGIEVLDDLEEVIAQVTPPRSDEEIEALEQESAADAEKAQIEGMEAQAEAEKAAEDAKDSAEEEVATSESAPPDNLKDKESK